MSAQNPSRSSSASDDLTRAVPRVSPGGGDAPPYGQTTDATGAMDGMLPAGGANDAATYSPYGDQSGGGDTGAGMKDKAADAASMAKDKATEMAGTASEKARQATGAATEKLDAQRDTVAGGLDTVATTLRDKAETIPGGDKTTQAAQTAADKLETASTYLRQHEVNDMMSDLETMVRTHPTESLVVALAAGFLLGRALKN
jgi:ElaB/YqjD/DUF883 family membrane-anchored ribosome-binding protein